MFWLLANTGRRWYAWLRRRRSGGKSSWLWWGWSILRLQRLRRRWLRSNWSRLGRWIIQNTRRAAYCRLCRSQRILGICDCLRGYPTGFRRCYRTLGIDWNASHIASIILIIDIPEQNCLPTVRINNWKGEVASE
jgi:hypothetical protein